MIIEFEHKHHEEFFRHIVGAKKTGSVVVSRHTDIGRLLYSLAVPSELPKTFKKTPGFHAIEFEFNQQLNFDINSKFWYYPKWAQEKINDYVIAEFNQSRRYYLLLSRDIGLQLKSAAEIFLAAHNISPDKYSTIVRADHRMRSKTIKIIQEIVQRYGFQ